MKKRYKVLLIGSLCVTALMAYGWKKIHNLEYSQNCRIYSKEEYFERYQIYSLTQVPTITPTAHVSFSFVNKMNISDEAVFDISLDTAPQVMEDNRAVEFHGKYTDKIKIPIFTDEKLGEIFPDLVNDELRQVTPTFRLFDPQKYAMCSWQADTSILIDLSKVEHYEVELLNYRFVEGNKYPSAYRIKKID